MKRRNKIFIIGIVSIFILLLLSLGIANFTIAPYIIRIEKLESIQYEDQMIINVEVGNYFFKFNKATWCLLKNTDDSSSEEKWVQAENGYCSFSVLSGNYHVFVKDSYNNIATINNQSVEINKVLDIHVNKETFYMYTGMEDEINYSLVNLGEVNEQVTFQSNRPDIVQVENGKIKALQNGEAIITIHADNQVSKDVRVIVSPHITSPKIDTNKPYISCRQFSKEEASILDAILFDRVAKAGEGTRAGVVAAARFLTLEFAYRVHYFYENGRLNNYYPYLKVDGEGRYYHKGLYLHESKFAKIESKFVGPAIWGCDLQNYTDWGPWVTGKYYPNGLDCSGFVTWALLNGGFDIGDIGAGIEEGHQDLTDLGERVSITEELMQSGRVKVGDLIGLNGHAAILAGIDDSNYYIAESLNTTKGVVMTVVPKNKLVHNSIYTYVVLMDNVYNADGNLTTMW